MMVCSDVSVREDLRPGVLGAGTVREYRFASTGVMAISIRGVDKAFLVRRKLELQVL